MTYVNAGQNPPLLRRADGSIERLGGTGIALGMFEGSTYEAVETIVRSGDMLVLYSDGITEAENPAGQPFEESGLERVRRGPWLETPAELAPAILQRRRGACPRFAVHRRSDGADPQEIVVVPEAAHRFGCLIQFSDSACRV